MEEKQDILEELTLPGNVTAKDVEFKVVFNKKKYDVIFNLDSTIAQLKEHLHTIIGENSVIFEITLVEKILYNEM
jgi:uncharacterized protein YkvS